MYDENHNNQPPLKNMTKKQMWQILLMILVIGTVWSYLAQKQRPAAEPKPDIVKTERTYPIMGTIAQVTFYTKTESQGEMAADAVLNTFTGVSNACNIYNPQSELSRLNKTAFDKPFKCSDMLWHLLQAGRKAYNLSGGDFDISARPLMLLWGFYRKRGETLPSAAETTEALGKTGLDKVVFNDLDKSVKFKVSGMSLDLGGMAKGAAVDLAAKAVVKLGVHCGIINLGGNMLCLSVPPPGRETFVIGVRNPLNKAEICDRVEVLDQALATSGNYERYVTIKGKQYTHIMNVRTGKPVSDMYSVTVIAPTALETDIFSTSVFIKGVAYARDIVKSHPELAFLIIQPGPQGKPVITEVNGQDNQVEWGDVEL